MAYLQKDNFLTIDELILDVIDELKLLGFTEIYEFPTSPSNKTISVTLQSPTSFLLPEQPWRIKFLAKAESSTSSNTKVLSVFAGTDIQLPNDGSHGIKIDYSKSTATRFYGEDAFGHIASKKWGDSTVWNDDEGPEDDPVQIYAPDQFLPASQWINRGYFFYSRMEFAEDTENQVSDTYSYRSSPMSYTLSYTSRGLFLGIWNAQTEESGLRFSWFLIQRSVDRSTGAVRGTTPSTANSICPLFCVFGHETSTATASPNQAYGIFTVREKSLKVPGPKYVFTEQSYGVALQEKYYTPRGGSSTVFIGSTGDPLGVTSQAYADREDCPIFLNPCKQVSFSEDGNYMVTFISELVSNKFRYPDELDMIATISADLIGLNQELSFTVYGESTPRTYVALPNNRPFGTGMRLLVLKS